MLTMPYRASGSCHDRNTERRGIPRHASGAARPRHPRAPFLWIAKERRERKLAPGDDAGLLPATRYARPAQKPVHGRRGSRARRPTPKSPTPRRRPPGAKTPHWPPRKKRTTTRTGSACLKRSSRIRFTTTRHAASLRTPWNGRIGFKPPYSKRETAAKGL